MFHPPVPAFRRLHHAHAGSARAPLRRSLPAPLRATHVPRARARTMSTTWLIVGGALVLFDIEITLAYLLHFVAGLVD